MAYYADCVRTYQLELIAPLLLKEDGKIFNAMLYFDLSGQVKGIYRKVHPTPEELAKIVTRSATILGMDIDPKGAMEIASRSRGTPRIANRFLRRVRDFAMVLGDKEDEKPQIAEDTPQAKQAVDKKTIEAE